MRRLGLSVAALMLAGCGLALTGAGDTGESSDAGEPGADSAAAWDAPGSKNDSTSPRMADATTDGAIAAADANDAPEEPDPPDAFGASDVTNEGPSSVADASAEADASNGMDAPVDHGSPPPDASCAGVLCHGACTSSTDCHSCSGATLLCAATKTCASDCASCGASTTECYACDMNRINPVGTCENPNAGAYCLTGSYASHCGCNTVADCPGAKQVCAPPASPPNNVNWCYTCGENVPSAAGACKGGGMCVPAVRQCL